MAKRGHEFGLISTFFTTWVLKTNGAGKVWISDGIASTAAGCDTQVSVLQVCPPASCQLCLWCDVSFCATPSASACSAPDILAVWLTSVCIMAAIRFLSASDPHVPGV